jgi:hypothetical protein
VRPRGAQNTSHIDLRGDFISDMDALGERKYSIV